MLIMKFLKVTFISVFPKYNFEVFLYNEPFKCLLYSNEYTKPLSMVLYIHLNIVDI